MMENTNVRTDEMHSFSGQSSGVRLEKLVKKFPSLDGNGEFVAVDHIDLDIKDGEMVTLLGPSGCGKTTTLRMISGFEFPTSGSVFIGNSDVANVPPNKRGISMVFQSYALFPHMTIFENVAYGLNVKKLPKAEVRARTSKVLELMQIETLKDRFPNQLPGDSSRGSRLQGRS